MYRLSQMKESLNYSKYDVDVAQLLKEFLEHLDENKYKCSWKKEWNFDNKLALMGLFGYGWKWESEEVRKW